MKIAINGFGRTPQEFRKILTGQVGLIKFKQKYETSN